MANQDNHDNHGKQYHRKFIESVHLPLEAINKACVHEKMPGIGAHPRGLHLWWARRPLAAARAVIWASIVDDPFDRPDLFPTKEAAQTECDKLAAILRQLVVWENSNKHEVIDAATSAMQFYIEHDDLFNSTKHSDKSKWPRLLDPFAGGGAIPLEGARLGLTSYAQDLNPVAVLINKAMIEIPPRFANMRAVNPDSNPDLPMEHYTGTAGLAEDVEYYGKWMRARAMERVGSMYPKAQCGLSGGFDTAAMPPTQPPYTPSSEASRSPSSGEAAYRGDRHAGGDVSSRGSGGFDTAAMPPTQPPYNEATVIAWLWTRTVRCPNPLCRCEAPLAGSFVLSKKEGREAYVEVQYGEDGVPSFTVRHGTGAAQRAKIGKGQFQCIKCGAVIAGDYIKREFTAHRNGARLMAVVAEGEHGREYLTPTAEHEQVAQVPRRDDAPSEEMNTKCTDIVSGRGFGFTHWSELFTNRQLASLCTFSDLVGEAREQVLRDAQAQGMADAEEYAAAIATYLAFAVDRMADFSSSCTRWVVKNEKTMNTFSKQAIPMIWDYPEVNVLADAVGGFSTIVSYLSDCIKTLPAGVQGYAAQHDAREDDSAMQGVMVSFDPPYYDNIAYADLSDFFYVWLRRALRAVYPALFATIATPKGDELIASPYRFEGGKKEATRFYEEGMASVFCRIRGIEHIRYPMTVYYAYRQSDSDEGGTSSTGWETLLTSIVQAGFTITGTVPLRTEQTTRALGLNTNALASSVVIVCRPRPANARPLRLGQFVVALQDQMDAAIADMASVRLNPVDMAQAAIGRGMEVYSAASAVLYAEGGRMDVRTALKEINRALDAALQRGSGDIDEQSRVCFDVWGKWHWDEVRYGDVDTLARMRGTSVAAIAASGAAISGGGKFRLLSRADVAAMARTRTSDAAAVNAAWRAAGERAEGSVWLAAQTLAAVMEVASDIEAAYVVLGCKDDTAEKARTMCYQLYQVCIRRDMAAEARAYNVVVSMWRRISDHVDDIKKHDGGAGQGGLGL